MWKYCQLHFNPFTGLFHSLWELRKRYLSQLDVFAEELFPSL